MSTRVPLHCPAHGHEIPVYKVVEHGAREKAFSRAPSLPTGDSRAVACLLGLP